MLTPAITASAFEPVLVKALNDFHVPNALHSTLLPLLRELPAMSRPLLGNNAESARAFESVIDGLYLTLQPELAMLTEQITAYYANTALEKEWIDRLTMLANQWLTQRMEIASQREADVIAPVFAELFNYCAQPTMADRPIAAALEATAPAAGQVHAALLQAGVYSALAQQIDASWAEAWQLTAANTGASSASGLRHSSAAMDDSLSAEFIAAFRSALKKRVDTLSASGNVMILESASSAAAAQYAQVMHRQLYMLTQFINAENMQTT